MAFKPNVGDIFLNKYEIVSLVGEGAFGCVYRARDQKLDRIVAIKFINAVSGVLERFADELEAIKGLDHPNIVRLYDFDILRDGVPCMVMEFVNGREIGDILVQDGTFDTTRICEIALQVVDALVETHKHGIIHCDLKPENIMLTSVGARTDVVKLIDFGVASLLSKSNDTERSKMLVGTPQYMAPEQIRHGELGPWTDIYAMGLILIELFTGQFVFDHEDPREVLKMQLYSPVNIPHNLACTELGPIIAKAVEKDISKRYQNTQQFYDDLKEAAQTMQAMLRQKPQRQHQDSIQFRNRAMPSIFEDFGDFSGHLDSSAQNQIPLLGAESSPFADGSADAGLDSVKIENLGLDALNSSLSSSFAENHISLDTENKDKKPEPAGPKGDLHHPITLTAKEPLLRISDSDLSTPRKKVEQVSSTKEVSASSKRNIGILVACFIILALVGGGSYLYNKGYLEAWGILSSSTIETHAQKPNQDGDNQPAQTAVRFTTLKNTANTMIDAASRAAGFGVTQEIANVTSWRIIGTPMSAAIYANDVRICHHSPCTINIFGNPDKVRLELRTTKKSMEFTVSDKDPSQPVMVVLGK